MRIRRLTRSDVPFADQVRHLAGWNQTLEDWERFLATEPEGCFLAEWNGTPAGTATTTVYGPALAWIGMVLVHPDCRGRGVGRALVRHCVEYLSDRAITCIKLDATPFGESIYDSLGFKTEWTLARWSGASSSSLSRESAGRLRPWRLDEQAVEALDAGLELIEGLVGRSEGQTLYWDIPDLNVAAVSWAERHGFTKQRSLTRMFLGINQLAGDPRRQFALSGPETG